MYTARQLLILLSCTVLVGCTTVPTVEEAAVMDVATTAVGLASGAQELNPLGPVVGSLLKLVYITGIVKRTPQGDRFVSSLWTGAAANNIAVTFMLNPLLSIATGITVGYYVYTLQKPPSE
jgi:hypothetical protein